MRCPATADGVCTRYMDGANHCDEGDCFEMPEPDERCPDCGVLPLDMSMHRGEFHARQSGAARTGRPDSEAPR